MEKETRGKRPFSLLAGIAAAVTLVLEVYFTYLRNDAGTAPNAWGYLLIAGYLCLAVGCFTRNRIVLGIGFSCIAVEYVTFTMQNLSWASQSNYYELDLKLLVVFQFSAGIAATLIAVICFFKKASGLPLFASAIVVEVIHLGTRVAYLVHGTTLGYPLSEVSPLIIYTLVYAVSVILAAVALYKGEFGVAEPAPQLKPRHSVSADELLRLHALMEEGVLSQEEFDGIRSKFAQ